MRFDSNGKFRQLLLPEDFLGISAQINYLLSARHPSYEAIARKILGGRQIQGPEEAVVEGVRCLIRAYRNRLRRLGPLAVLHPLRAAHLLVAASPQPTLLDVLTAFFHDYYEDIHTSDLAPDLRKELDDNFDKVKAFLSEDEAWELEQRLQSLTCDKKEHYQAYLGRLMEQSSLTPELICIKLADRLDNSFDMRIVQENYTDYFRLIYHILFLNVNQDQVLGSVPSEPGQLDEAHRLYQLFKNAIFLTLLRLYHRDDGNSTAKLLFGTLAAVSQQEAGRILGQLFSRDVKDREKQREILMDTMNYCQSGGLERLTPANRGHQLDGLFKDRFDFGSRAEREEALGHMQKNKQLMAEAAVAFLGVFEAFLSSPNYQVAGIKATGLSLDEDETLDLRDPAWKDMAAKLDEAYKNS